MEECHTPNYLQGTAEFKFNRSPKPITDIDYIQGIQQLTINNLNVRCFTPTVDGLLSPGLSPIYDITEISPTVSEFKKPLGVAKKNRSKSPNMQSPQQQQQQTKQQLNKSNPSPKLEKLDITVPTLKKQDSEYSLDAFNSTATTTSTDVSKSNSSISLDLLNRTLNVPVLLRSVGLEEYAEMFAEKGIDVDEFLNIEASDLPRMGVKSKEHCKRIMDLLNEFNNSM